MHNEAGAIAFVTGLVAVRLTPKGEYIFPKGHIEGGEAPEETALRELEEETGLLGGAPRFVGDDEYVADSERFRVHYFTMTAEPGPQWAKHKDKDTVLLPPQEALRKLNIERHRILLRESLRILGHEAKFPEGPAEE